MNTYLLREETQGEESLKKDKNWGWSLIGPLLILIQIVQVWLYFVLIKFLVNLAWKVFENEDIVVG